MSDANKVLSGRKRRVGAIHGIISLAVIFFVALSAQASAKDTKTFLKCEFTKSLTKPKMLFEKVYLPSFKISYELGDNNKILNMSIKDLTGCERLIGGKHDEMQLLFTCEQDRHPIWTKSLEIDRISGGFVYSAEATREWKGKIDEHLYFGDCKKKKQKF